MSRLRAIWRGPRRYWLVYLPAWAIFVVSLWTPWAVAGAVIFAAGFAYSIGYQNGGVAALRGLTRDHLREADAAIESARERVERLAPDHPERRAWNEAREWVTKARREYE